MIEHRTSKNVKNINATFHRDTYFLYVLVTKNVLIKGTYDFRHSENTYFETTSDVRIFNDKVIEDNAVLERDSNDITSG